MIRRRLCYLLLLGAGIYFILLYDFQGLRFLLGCAVCIPALSFLFLLPVKFRCHVKLEMGRETAVRGELTEGSVTLENGGLLPISRVLVEMHWNVPGEKEVKIRKWICGMGARTREICPVEFRATHCGAATLTLAKVFVYDYLGIFSLPVKRVERMEICIMPVIAPVPAAVEQAYARFLGEAGEEREGDLLLREFQPGDSLHRVYWKMMAKGGEMQVRDFERSGSVALYLHFSDGLREEVQAWDRYLDRAVSLLYFFSEECRRTVQISTEVVWRLGDTFFRYLISDSAALQWWSLSLLRGEPAGTVLSEEEIPCLERGWHLEEDCGLYFGEQCVYEE